MRRLFMAIMALLLAMEPSAQNMGRWRAGSAYKLSGRIYSLSCFVSGPNDSWTYSEKLQMLALLSESQEWISREAVKYGNSVDFFHSGCYGLTDDIKLPSIERGTASGKEPVDWVSLVLGKVGYASPLAFDHWVKSSTHADNYQVIIFVKGCGNSYAMAYSNEMSREKFYVEGAVLYECFNGGEKLPAAAIAHELLHLYGAWDLYKTFNQTEQNEQRARALFPNSIMLRTSYNINELDVADITAWLVGWNNNPEKWFDTFKPLELPQSVATLR